MSTNGNFQTFRSHLLAIAVFIATTYAGNIAAIAIKHVTGNYSNFSSGHYIAIFLFQCGAAVVGAFFFYSRSRSLTSQHSWQDVNIPRFSTIDQLVTIASSLLVTTYIVVNVGHIITSHSFSSNSNTIGTYRWCVSLVYPIFEQCAFTAFLWGFLRTKSVRYSAIITSTLFCAAHIHVVGLDYRLAILFSLEFICLRIYSYYNYITLPIITHVAFNALSFWAYASIESM
jgi:hypothetical protein